MTRPVRPAPAAVCVVAALTVAGATPVAAANPTGPAGWVMVAGLGVLIVAMHLSYRRPRSDDHPDNTR
jgi:hypothetical protein